MNNAVRFDMMSGPARADINSPADHFTTATLSGATAMPHQPTPAPIDRQLSLHLDGDLSSGEVPEMLHVKKRQWKTLLGQFIVCADCNAAAPRTGASQRYCESCSKIRDVARKLKYATANPAPPEVRRKYAARKRSRTVLAGIETSNGERWDLSSVFDDAAGMAWVRRFSVPFSYALSKNHLWSLGSEGHVFLRGESRKARAYLAGEVKKALCDVSIVQDKLWISLIVQKPDHRGDAINVIDLVADAIKDALPLDDRWYCIKGVDWQIIKQEPRLYIGIGQSSTEDVRACSHCGRLLPYRCYQKNKSNRFGIGRACMDCSNKSKRNPV